MKKIVRCTILNFTTQTLLWWNPKFKKVSSLKGAKIHYANFTITLRQKYSTRQQKIHHSCQKNIEKVSSLKKDIWREIFETRKSEKDIRKSTKDIEVCLDSPERFRHSIYQGHFPMIYFLDTFQMIQKFPRYKKKYHDTRSEKTIEYSTHISCKFQIYSAKQHMRKAINGKSPKGSKHSKNSAIFQVTWRQFVITWIIIYLFFRNCIPVSTIAISFPFNCNLSSWIPWANNSTEILFKTKEN